MLNNYVVKTFNTVTIQHSHSFHDLQPRTPHPKGRMTTKEVPETEITSENAVTSDRAAARTGRQAKKSVSNSGEYSLLVCSS